MARLFAIPAEVEQLKHEFSLQQQANTLEILRAYSAHQNQQRWNVDYVSHLT